LATKTKIVVGKVGDNISSEAVTIEDETLPVTNTLVTNEVFHSVFDTPVSLTQKPIAFSSVTVTETGEDPATFVEAADADYTVDYTNGTITVIDGGDMEDDTDYLITYTVAPKTFLRYNNLVAESEEVLNAASEPLVRDTDYVIDNSEGSISQIYDDAAGPFTVSYDFNPRNLAYKINAVVSGLDVDTVLFVCTSRAGCNGVATIVYTEAEA
jgi:hypothetical protein